MDRQTDNNKKRKFYVSICWNSQNETKNNEGHYSHTSPTLGIFFWVFFFFFFFLSFCGFHTLVLSPLCSIFASVFWQCTFRHWPSFLIYSCLKEYNVSTNFFLVLSMRLQASHHSFLANAPYIGIHSISYCNESWLNASSPVLQQTFSYVRCIMLRSVHTVLPSCFYRWIVSNFLCWLYKRCISHPVSWFRTVWSVNSYTSERSYPCVYYVQLPFCFTTTAGPIFLCLCLEAIDVYHREKKSK